MTTTPPDHHAASAMIEERMQAQLTFQISVDTDNLKQGLVVAAAAVAAGVTILEMGTPLLKLEGALNVVPAFRKHFPNTLLLADMKTMDGSAIEAHAVFGGGGNIIDFLAISGTDTARSLCAVRDEYRRKDPETPRLVFADILLPHQGPAENAVAVALEMLEAGVDGVGVHLQADARRADPALWQSDVLADAARAVWKAVGDRASVQVVGGLSVDQASDLARDGLKAFVISANFGLPDAVARYGLPPDEMQQHIAEFIRQVGATR